MKSGNVIMHRISTLARAETPYLVVSLVLMLTACGDRTERGNLESAKARIERRETAAAIVELKALLQTKTDTAPARLLLGEALMQQGDVNAAQIELEKALIQGSPEAEVVPLLARAMLLQGKYKELIQLYSQVVLSQPTAQAKLRASVASAFMALGQRMQAVAALEEAERLAPNLQEAAVLRARMLAGEGKFDQALAVLEPALAQVTANGELYLLKALILRYGKNDLDAAQGALDLALKDPSAALLARSAKVQLYLAGQQLAEAKLQVEALRKSHPSSGQTAWLDALLAYSSKDWDKADTILTDMLRFAPGNTKLLTLAGAASLQRGALLNAEARLGRVVQTVERADLARKLLAETYLRMGQPEKALVALRPLLDVSPPEGDALALAGQAYLQQGELTAAEEMLTAAAKVKPGDVQIRTSLALASLSKGQANEAFESLQSLAASDKGDTADLALISAHLRRGEFDAALKAVERLEKKRPGAPNVALLRGAALNGRGDIAAARLAFESVLKSEPKHVAAIGNLVKLDLAERRFDAARSRLQALIDATPRDSTPRLMMLEVLERQGAKPSELMTVIDQALQANSGDAAAYIAKMALQGRAGDVKGAASTAQLAISRISGSAELLDAAGRALAQSGDYQQALSVFKQLSQLWPRSPVPDLRQLELHTRRGDLAAAKASLARAFEIAPLSPDVIDQFLAQARRSGDSRPAMDAARQLQRRFANLPFGWAMEGDIHAQRKDWPASIAAYRTAMAKTDTPGPLPRRLHAILLLAQGAAAADRFASDWLASHPKDVAFREYLGSQAIHAKNFSLAERRFRETLEVAPGSLVAVNNLAWLLAERGDKQAVDMARRALALAPRSATVLDTLAKALASQGDIAAAVDAQRQAVRIQPNRATYQVNLIELLIRQGDRQAAQQQLAELEKLSAGSAQGREAIASLRRRLDT